MECISPGMPAIMGNPYPMEFTQVGDNIEIRFEEWDASRVIHMGGNVADPDTMPLSKMGYSVGPTDLPHDSAEPWVTDGGYRLE